MGLDLGMEDLNLMDVPGKRLFTEIYEEYMPPFAAILIVYDITNRKSFELIPNLMNHVKDKAKVTLKDGYYQEEYDNCLYYILGNKVDLEAEREVETHEGEMLVNLLNSKRPKDFPKVKFHEVSGITGQNVDQIFDDIATRVLVRKNSKKTPEQRAKERKLGIGLPGATATKFL